MEEIHFLSKNMFFVGLEYSEEVLYFLLIIDWGYICKFLYCYFVEHVHHEDEGGMIVGLIFDGLDIKNYFRIEFHEEIENLIQCSLFSSFFAVFIECFKHIDSPIVQSNSKIELFQIGNRIISFFDPLNCIVDKTTIKIDPFLEIADHLIIFGVHIELCNVIIFQFHYKLREFSKFPSIEIILHHQLEYFFLFCVEI